MADKSAFVPGDAIGGHKGTDDDVDMDAELFGAGKKDAKPATPAPAPAPAAAPTLAAQPKFEYKKATNFKKVYAAAKK